MGLFKNIIKNAVDDLKESLEKSQNELQQKLAEGRNSLLRNIMKDDDADESEVENNNKKYSLCVHYCNDPEDLEGYDDEIEAESIEAAKDYVKKLDDFDRINYYVLESEDGDEYYNSSDEEGFVDRGGYEESEDDEDWDDEDEGDDDEEETYEDDIEEAEEEAKRLAEEKRLAEAKAKAEYEESEELKKKLSEILSSLNDFLVAKEAEEAARRLAEEKRLAEERAKAEEAAKRLTEEKRLAEERAKAEEAAKRLAEEKRFVEAKAKAEKEEKGLKLKDGVLTYKGKFEFGSGMRMFIYKNKPFIQKVDFSQAIELSVLPDLIFWECTNLQEILLPEGLNIIGKSAFNKCESLKNIVIPSTVESIEKYAFKSSGIESISLPENLKKIGDWVFDGCKSLQKVDIPSAESIGDKVFDDCNIESIILPANLKTFGSCGTLYVDASPCREMQNISIRDRNNKVIYLPSDLEEATLSGIESGAKIYAPKSLKRIKTDDYIFDTNIICFAPRIEMHIEKCRSGNIYVKEEFVERYKALAQREGADVEIKAMDKIYEYFYDE